MNKELKTDKDSVDRWWDELREAWLKNQWERAKEAERHAAEMIKALRHTEKTKGESK